jgi:hypothetical protein
MLDVVAIILLLILSTACLLYVKACGRLKGGQQ